MVGLVVALIASDLLPPASFRTLYEAWEEGLGGVGGSSAILRGEEVLLHILGLDPPVFEVAVSDGVATISGRVQRRSTAEMIAFNHNRAQILAPHTAVDLGGGTLQVSSPAQLGTGL